MPFADSLVIHIILVLFKKQFIQTRRSHVREGGKRKERNREGYDDFHDESIGASSAKVRKKIRNDRKIKHN